MTAGVGGFMQQLYPVRAGISATMCRHDDSSN
jgi:hypothetical protein